MWHVKRGSKDLFLIDVLCSPVLPLISAACESTYGVGRVRLLTVVGVLGERVSGTCLELERLIQS